MKTIEEEQAERRAALGTSQDHELPVADNTSRPSDGPSPLLNAVDHMRKGNNSTGYGSLAEQFEMYRIPFFRGKAHKAGVDVDNIGSMRERWV